MNLAQLLKLCLDRDMKTMMDFYIIPLSNLHMVKVWCSGAIGLQCSTFKEDALLHLKKTACSDLHSYQKYVFIGIVISEGQEIDADNSNAQGLTKFVIVLLLSKQKFSTKSFPP